MLPPLDKHVRCDRWTCCHVGTTQPCCCCCYSCSLNNQDETHRDVAHAATAAAAQACCCASSCCHRAPASAAAAAAHSCSGIVMCLNSLPAFRPSQTLVTTASMPCSSRRACGGACVDKLLLLCCVMWGSGDSGALWGYLGPHRLPETVRCSWTLPRCCSGCKGSHTNAPRWQSRLPLG